MKFIKGYKLISQEELSKLETDAEVRGAKESKQRIDELKRSIEKKNGEIDHLRQQQEDLCETAKRQIERLEAKIEVLEEERDNVREVVKKSMENEDLAAVLAAKKEGLDKREAKLADEEDAKSKASYADGLADGLRKAHEITQKDRENAMKVAMVSAASHTPAETMKELNNVHQLTADSSEE